MWDIFLNVLQNPLIVQLVTAAIVIIGAYIFYRFVFKRALSRFAKTAGLEEKYVKPIRNLGSIIIFVIVAILLLWVFEIREAFFGLLTGAGFAGIVVGLAVRDVASDLFTGMLLHIYRPFEIGDGVLIGDVGGQVKDIGMKGVTLKAWSGEIIVVPNSVVRTSIVKNFTVDQRRCDITLFLDYDSDFLKALKVCKKAIEETSETLKEPAPIIRVDDFQERYMKILILVWFQTTAYWDGYTKVKKRIAEGFRSQQLKPPKLKVSTQNK